ncbi:MAG: hypothetical protein ACPGU5_01025 [Lishizhenia sp.]
MKQIIFISIVLTAFLISCNKEKRFSKRLEKGETWIVKELTVNGEAQNILGEWLVAENTDIVKPTDIYEEVPQLTWQAQDTLDAVLEWQFQDKGKTFVLNYFVTCDNCDGEDLDALDYFAFDISGKYDVEQHKRKEMKFISKALPNSTQEIEIKIERKE